MFDLQVVSENSNSRLMKRSASELGLNNKLLWARKYARIVVRGYYLFREANSCPRAKLEGNCELRGTDNVQGQLYVHISEAKSSLLSLLSFKYFLSQRKQRREKNKIRSKPRWLLTLSGTGFSTIFLIPSSVNWRKTLHFEVFSPDGVYCLWAGMILRLITSVSIYNTSE